ncbi:6627_t:CDS:2, partial [Racocetra persica]
KESETSSEEATSDEIALLSDNTNQTLSNVSTFSTNNRAPVRVYLLSTPDRGHKPLGVTTDNASNMIAMGCVLKERMHNEFSNINVQHFRCGAHILNIIVKEGIKSVKKLQRIRPMTDILVVSNQMLKPNYPDEQEWEIIMDLLALLEPMYHATVMLSLPTLPTQGDLRFIFRDLIIHLNNNENLVINTQHAVANAMKVKFMSYWAHLNESSAISGLLDHHNKLSTYDITEHEQTINKLHEVYQIYKPPEEKKPLPPTTATKST